MQLAGAGCVWGVSLADLEEKVGRVSCLPGFYLLTLEAPKLKSIFFAQTLELRCKRISLPN